MAIPELSFIESFNSFKRQGPWHMSYTHKIIIKMNINNSLWYLNIFCSFYYGMKKYIFSGLTKCHSHVLCAVKDRHMKDIFGYTSIVSVRIVEDRGSEGTGWIFNQLYLVGIRYAIFLHSCKLGFYFYKHSRMKVEQFVCTLLSISCHFGVLCIVEQISPSKNTEAGRYTLGEQLTVKVEMTCFFTLVCAKICVISD